MVEYSKWLRKVIIVFQAVFLLSPLVACRQNDGSETSKYSISGRLAGLQSNDSVTLLLNGSSPLTLTSDGTFRFSNGVSANENYVVTVGTQPKGEICTVSNGTGAGVTGDVTTVLVTCSTVSYTVSGTLTGLNNGQQVTLQNNNADSLALSADGSFTFKTSIAHNGSYAITVASQPTGQTCTVTNGVGAGMVANVNSVTVTCSTNTYTLGGSVAGLVGGQQVTLFNNSADALTVAVNGEFTFPTRIAYNGSYVVTVGTQPIGQTCTVSNGSGAGMVANVTAIAVNCSSNTYHVGGTITGLSSGQQVTLLNNNTDPVILSANGNFTFPTPLAYNGNYAVTVGTQPTGQTCTVSQGTGSGIVANVDSVRLVCSTNKYTVSGTVTGLARGQQVTLLNNGADPLIVSDNAKFTFAMPVAFQGSYAVTVGTQPTGQTCSVSNGIGTATVADINAVAVTCSTNTFKVSGTVTGLTSGQQVTLKNNGADPLIVSSNGSFTFQTGVVYNGSYAVTVDAQPNGQTCSVSNSAGAGMVADVDSIAVTCSTSTYVVGGTLIGLTSGQQVTLLNNNADPLTLSANGGFSFPIPVAFNGSYAVSIGAQPTGQTCSVSRGVGAGMVADVSSITVMCSTNTYMVGGAVTGLAAGQQVTLLNNNADALTLLNDGNFTFPTPVTYQGSYAVTIGTQPTGQTCTVTNGVGAGMVANVNSVAVICSINTYTVGGTVAGLAPGQQVTLLNNDTDALIVPSDGRFVFSIPVAHHGSFAVTVGTQPIGQICTVNNGVGVDMVANVSSIAVMCSTSTYSVSGTVAGLAPGQQVTLLDNNADPLILLGNGGFTFPTQVAYQGSYAVTVGTQPTGQTCSVSNGAGSGMVANVNSVAVICSTSTYKVGGTVMGLATGQEVTLLDNNADPITLADNGSFVFPSPVAYQGSYSVTIGTQPTSQTCTVGNGTGAGMVADINSIIVTCSDRTYTVGGTLTGLANGQQLTLLNNGADPLILSADGSFTFATPTAFQGSYAITVGTQPTGQTCTVTNGAGGGLMTNVSSVVVICSANTYRVGGTMTGLANGQQVTLLNNNADPLTLFANGDFTFPTRVAYDGSYAITIGTQPTGQACTVGNGTGVGIVDNVTSIVVTCTANTYTVGGTVTGLASGQQVTLVNNNTDPITLSANGSFTFASAVAANGGYAVSVSAQPLGQSCTVSNGSATSISSNVIDIAVTCSTATYTVSGIVSGLADGQQLILSNNNKEFLAISSNGAFSFATPIFYNGSYAVTVSTQPSNGICTVVNGVGFGMVANINSVKVVCSATGLTVGGAVTGLIGGQQLTLLNNNADPIIFKVSKSFTFVTRIAYQGSYAVTVGAQPPGQTCTVNNGVGAGMVSNVGSVAVVCSTTSYKVGGSITGLARGQQVTLFNNNADPLILSANGDFAFPTRTAYNGSYAVTVGTQPIGQICTVGRGSGTGVVGDVASISVICSPNAYMVGGALTGLLSGQQVTLYNNNSDPVTLSANGSFTFAAPVAEQSGYSINVGTQPVNQTCTVTNGSAANVYGDINNISVNCVSNFYKIFAYVAALANDPVTLLNNGGDAISPASEGVYNFPTLMRFGSTYNVTISRQPTYTTCTLTSSSGVVTGDMIVRIYCGTAL
ncbi:beta strand repeat-containing protein [Ralstonia chuxiongensis]|uniref:beta strand repeat-containing protein n=1 Tax=Ralstonia chuxiongensis TaxID=2957504 RepID=UPI0028F64BD8|nr:DUF4369 domain-containing protein [Ralstonia chuxiongensis]CAJ0784185.1 hypothetical protein R8510_05227 [Ralstonia chuxiongensis]